MKYFFETYGCQMNVSESNGIEVVLKKRGWQASETVETADLVIINTCSVRITAEQRVFGRLGFFSGLKKKTGIKILVIGCMAERLKQDLKEDFPFVDFVVGVSERAKLENIFSMLEVDTSNTHNRMSILDKNVSLKEKYLFSDVSYKEGDFQSFVPIMNGCNNFCTYCIVPHVRGREISRNVQEILDEVEFLSKNGVKEITLLGQNVNSYLGTYNGNTIDFPTLLQMICRKSEETNSIQWIRFLSSHPKDLSMKLIEVIAREKKVCKSIHLPVQHGSNGILKAMNRKYTREHYIELVRCLRERIPDIVISTDILIGFPGETEADVEATLSLIEDVQFDSSFMYHYNPREGTKAYDLPNRIPEPVKIERLTRVINLQQQITEKKLRLLLEKQAGKPIRVLVESVSKKNKQEYFGHTEGSEMVVIKNCDSHNIGQFVDVKLESISGKTLVGLLM